MKVKRISKIYLKENTSFYNYYVTKNSLTEPKKTVLTHSRPINTFSSLHQQKGLLLVENAIMQGYQ